MSCLITLSNFLVYLLQICVFFLKLSLLSLSFGQSLSLQTSLLLQARDTSCKTKPRESSEKQTKHFYCVIVSSRTMPARSSWVSDFSSIFSLYAHADLWPARLGQYWESHVPQRICLYTHTQYPDYSK